MEQILEAVKTAMPGLLGATSSAVVLSHGALKRRAGVLFMSSAAAYYSYEYVANLLGWPTGMASFIVGLLFSPIIDKLLTEINEAPLAKAIARLIGVKEK